MEKKFIGLPSVLLIIIFCIARCIGYLATIRVLQEKDMNLKRLLAVFMSLSLTAGFLAVQPTNVKAREGERGGGEQEQDRRGRGRGQDDQGIHPSRGRGQDDLGTQRSRSRRQELEPRRGRGQDDGQRRGRGADDF